MATFVTIAAGFTAISLLDGFIHGVREEIRDGFTSRTMLGNVIVYRSNALEHVGSDQWLYSLTAEDQQFLDEYLKNDPAFLRRARFLSGTGLITNGKNSALFDATGYDISEGLAIRGNRWGWNAYAGKPLHQASPQSVLLGRGLALLMGCGPTFSGTPFQPGGGYRPEVRPFRCERPLLQLSGTTEHSQINAIDVEVSGLLDAGIREVDAQYVSLPLALIQRLFDTDKVSFMSIQLKEGADREHFMSDLRNAAKARGHKLDILPWERYPSAKNMRNGLQILQVFRNLFMSVIVSVAVLSVANIMMKSVNDRIGEIGTLRSIGFLRGDLELLFMLEGLFLAAVACILGWVVTSTSAIAITAAGFSYRAGVLSTPILLRIAQVPITWFISTLVFLLIAAGTAWLSARKATRIRITEALRESS